MRLPLVPGDGLSNDMGREWGAGQASGGNPSRGNSQGRRSLFVVVGRVSPHARTMRRFMSKTALLVTAAAAALIASPADAHYYYGYRYHHHHHHRFYAFGYYPYRYYSYAVPVAYPVYYGYPAYYAYPAYPTFGISIGFGGGYRHHRYWRRW
jgi:hypothetical protein